MNRKLVFIIHLSLVLLLFTGCGGGTSQRSHSSVSDEDREDFAHVVELHYTKGFSVENHPDYKVLHVYHPDAPDASDTYVLYLKGEDKPSYEGEVTSYITVPVENLITTSTVQIGALSLLDAEESIIGSTSIEYINSEKVRNRFTEGLITEVGKGMSQNMELILSLQPELILMDYIQSLEELEKYQDAGISLILFNSWKDQSPLGRAEWMKLVAMLVCKNQMAEEHFKKITSEYLEAKELVAHEKESIPVMYGQDYKGVWYVPGEHSYMAEMLRDARLIFNFIPEQVSSEPRSFEQVFSFGRHALVWLTSYAGKINSVDAFLSQNEHYQHFDAAKKGIIVSDNKRVNKSGGNDYWESGAYHPDLLLKDIIKVTRPHLLPDYETTYWQVLER